MCDHTYPDCNLQLLKRSFKANLQQVVDGLGGDDLEKEEEKKKHDTWEQCRICHLGGPVLITWSHPSNLDDGPLCDLLVHAEARSPLEEGDGFPQVALRHLHQCRDALHGHTNMLSNNPTTFALEQLHSIEDHKWFQQTICMMSNVLSATSLLYLRFSFSQMSNSRSSWMWLANGLKRNLEHLDVRGSIILQNSRVITSI